MLRRTLFASALIGASLLASPAAARVAGVEVWTDRGHESVYQPGDGMRVQVRPADDAYLLIYEIDAEGFVNVLFPLAGSAGWVAGGLTYRIPSDDSGLELVVQEPVGEAYIVAIASERPFREFPWYLKSADPGAGAGAASDPLANFGEPLQPASQADEESGITSDGRITGDPFVAMERIRRRVLRAPDDPDGFATAYTAYFVGTQVHYPRYVCYDCHRPGRWEWWDGFDPYYATCPVFGVRVNDSWVWGPAYWFGAVPYFVYYYQPDCPPIWYDPEVEFWSSWDGWRRWTTLWGPKSLTRYKSEPPPGYGAPPPMVKPGFGTGPGIGPMPAHTPSGRTPPGYVAGSDVAGRKKPAVTGRGGEARGEEVSKPAPRSPYDRPVRPVSGGGSAPHDRPPVSGRPAAERGEGGGRAVPATSPPSSPAPRERPSNPGRPPETRQSPPSYTPPPSHTPPPPSQTPPSNPVPRVEPARPPRQDPSPPRQEPASPPRTESRPAPPPDRSGSDRPGRGDRSR